MMYHFKCIKCGTDVMRDIPMDEYDTVKDKQTCNNCGNRLERVIEWNGPAKNLGGYSDVAGNANWQTN